MKNDHRSSSEKGSHETSTLLAELDRLAAERDHLAAERDRLAAELDDTRRHPPEPELAPDSALEAEMPEPEASEASLSRHGAGPGGRAAALVFIVASLVIGALVLYWGITR